MPRKSDTAVGLKEASGNGTPASGSGSVAEGNSNKDTNGVSIDDFTLPKSLVTRLAKGVLPQNTNVQKDAMLALTKGATVFINYLCTAANENAVKNNKKTINPKDILEAISQLELDEFRPRLEAELSKYEAIQSEKRAASKKTAKDKESAAKGTVVVTGESYAPSKSPQSPNEEDVEATHDADTPPPAKKRKAISKAANGGSAPKKAANRKKIVVVPNPEPVDEEDVDEDEDEDETIEVNDPEPDEEEEEEEEEGDDDEDSHNQASEEEVVEDVDEVEPPEDEALDNGDDSD